MGQMIHLAEERNLMAAHNLMTSQYREHQGPATTQLILDEVTKKPIALIENWLFSVEDQRITISPHEIAPDDDWGTAYVLVHTNEGMRFTGEIVEFMCVDGEPLEI